MNKYLSNKFPANLTLCSIMFLCNRTQCVNIDHQTLSVLFSHAGTPQGTIAGPNDCNLLINVLTFRLSYIKYIDDLSCLSVSENPHDNSLQNAAN